MHELHSCTFVAVSEFYSLIIGVLDEFDSTIVFPGSRCFEVLPLDDDVIEDSSILIARLSSEDQSVAEFESAILTVNDNDCKLLMTNYYGRVRERG